MKHYKKIINEDGCLDYYPGIFAGKNYFESIQQEVQWQEEYFQLYGKMVKAPRLIAWYGNPGVNYRYSGIQHYGSDWSSHCLAIKKKIEQITNHSFNGLLANYYRDGKDYMGWHRDNESSLGPQPVIASVSFGASRDFLLRHRQHKKKVTLPLHDGDLLIMSGHLQDFWQHSLPKRLKVSEPRINLTYRLIV